MDDRKRASICDRAANAWVVNKNLEISNLSGNGRPSIQLFYQLLSVAKKSSRERSVFLNAVLRKLGRHCLDGMVSALTTRAGTQSFWLIIFISPKTFM